ncbi:Transposon Ty3-I Gag-Pol polyprotein, partial [Choanephora cucurbitarum]
FTTYHTTEKECLAIVWALDYFHPYVHGANLTIYTDHAALKSILSTKLPKGRIARWILALLSYQFTILHKKGKLIQDADAVSRLTQNAQEDLTADTFKTLQQQDPELKVLLKEGVKPPFIWRNGVLGRRLENEEVKPVIPRQLVPTVLTQAHGGPVGGHFGIDKTLDKTRQIGWWHSQIQDVKTWIRTESTAAPMKPICPNYLGEIWAADIAVLSKSKKGNRYLLVFMEYLSKWLITAAIPSLDTDQVVQVLLFEVVLKLGVPARLITDNGSNFICEAMKQVCCRLGIQRSLTSVEHPQSNGLVERLNGTIKTSLAICTEGNPFDWDDQLPFVTFAYNTAKQSSTGFSPFEVLFGRKARLPVLPNLELEPVKSYETEAWSVYLKNRLPLLHGQVRKNIEVAQVRQKRAYNKGKRVKYDYKAGDLILRKNLNKLGFPKERWSGPWVVIEPNNAKVHISRLSGKEIRVVNYIIYRVTKDILCTSISSLTLNTFLNSNCATLKVAGPEWIKDQTATSRNRVKTTISTQSSSSINNHLE